MKIIVYQKFKDSYKKLPHKIKQRAERQELIFKNNPFDPRLKTHKLHGKLKHLWSFSVDNKRRIIFEFFGSDIIFLDIGDHDLYK